MVRRPLHHDLVKCSEHMGGIYNEKGVEVKSYNFTTKTFQGDKDLECYIDDKKLGSDIKSLMKYLYCLHENPRLWRGIP